MDRQSPKSLVTKSNFIKFSKPAIQSDVDERAKGDRSISRGALERLNRYIKDQKSGILM